MFSSISRVAVSLISHSFCWPIPFALCLLSDHRWQSQSMWFLLDFIQAPFRAVAKRFSSSQSGSQVGLVFTSTNITTFACCLFTPESAWPLQSMPWCILHAPSLEHGINLWPKWMKIRRIESCENFPRFDLLSPEWQRRFKFLSHLISLLAHSHFAFVCNIISSIMTGAQGPLRRIASSFPS